MKHTAETYSNINPAVFCGGAAVADYYGADNNNYVAGEGFCCGDNNLKTKSIADDSPNYEKLQYYYHSDHLGSASYITNLDGEVVQHIEYVPFGEVFLEERNNTWNTPFLFNGKELDEETGLYYYGARYYNPRISLWYGVDPLAEKYPAHSPYCYTMNNPIMLIDPDGRDPRKAIPFFKKALRQAPINEAAMNIKNLKYRMDGIKENARYFTAIRGFDVLANEAGIFSGNENTLTGTFKDINGIDVNGSLIYHLKNDVSLYDVTGVEFNEGRLGKGVTGGLMSSLSGFEIRLFNQKSNSVMSLVVSNKEQFEYIKKIYNDKMENEFNRLLNKNPQLKDFYMIEQEHHKLINLRDKATLKGGGDYNSPVWEEYNKALKTYMKNRQEYHKKYENN